MTDHPTAPVQDDDADRTAWLIEMESDCLSRGAIAWFGIHYWHPTKGFSHEIDEALQFARKQDAEAFKREFKLSGKVVEHMWPASRLSPTPETGLVEALLEARPYVEAAAERSRRAAAVLSGNVRIGEIVNDDNEVLKRIDAALSNVLLDEVSTNDKL